MAKTPKDPLRAKVEKICLSLPNTKLTMTWGAPHFRVGDKIFAGYGEENGVPVIGFKLDKKKAAALVKKPGFAPAPYVGRHGWVSMDLSRVKTAAGWAKVKEYVTESHCLISGC